MSDYTAWLVEINEPVSGSVYYQMEDDNDWTSDHDKALHFSRKQDAEKIIAYYGWTRAKAIEHMWPELTARDVIARRRPATNATPFPVPTSDLEKAQMKRPRGPRS